MTTHQIVKLTARPKGCHLITDEVLTKLQLPQEGLLHLFIQHTSAALAIQENASPEVRTDLDRALDRLAPHDESLYTHTEEGPDDMPAHVKGVLCGASVSIPIHQGKPLWGRWQGLYLLEFRLNAPPRSLVATVIS
jgi:secondary thiamine-phosphate synthase enzyme